MRKIIAKTVSVALVCVMAATVASCGETKKTGKEIRKIIYVPGKLVNIVA